MSKLRRIVRIFFLGVLLSLMSENSQAQVVDPRIKVISVITVYSIIGGTLLGLAAINFGAKKRSPFIGASLGLYSGVLFGSYLVIGHMYNTYKRDNQVPDDNNYYDTNSLYEDTGSGGSNMSDIYEYQRSLNSHSKIFWRKKYEKNFPSVYINFIKIQF